MANIPWIGTCRLCARTADKRRWSGDTDEAVGILMLLAISKDDFEERVRIVVQEMGYDVIDIHSAYTVSESINYQQHKATIAFHLNDVNETRPVLVGSFVPVMGRFKYDEVTWDDLLDLSAPPLWAVIDGVNWPEAADILGTVGKEDCVCLYSTTNTRSKTFAPWLVRLKLDSAVTKAMKKRAMNSILVFCFKATGRYLSYAVTFANLQWHGRQLMRMLRYILDFMTHEFCLMSHKLWTTAISGAF